MSKENEIPEDVLQPMLQSIKGMQRAKAPEAVFGRVMAEMRRPVARLVPISRISLVAACLVALIGLNIAIVATRDQTTSKNESNPLMEMYGTGSNYAFTY